MLPLVSVVIPTYNRAHLVERAVRSVLSQSFSNLEVIVVDDASTDGTREQVFALKQADPRLLYLRHETNRGAQAARNTGIRAANGNYIAFLDSDNEWLPSKLERQMSLFINNGREIKPGVVYAGFKWQYDDGRPSTEQTPRFKGYIYKEALREWIADTSTLVVRKDLLYKAGLFDERVRAYQEWDLCIRLARHAEFDYIPEPLSIYHIHSGPTISKDLMRSARGYLDVITLHRDEIIAELGRKVLSNHFLIVGHSFIQALDFESAKFSFWNAVKLWPIGFKAIIYWIAIHLGKNKYQQLVCLKRQLKSRIRGSWFGVKYLII